MSELTAVEIIIDLGIDCGVEAEAEVETTIDLSIACSMEAEAKLI